MRGLVSRAATTNKGNSALVVVCDIHDFAKNLMDYQMFDDRGAHSCFVNQE